MVITIVNVQPTDNPEMWKNKISNFFH